MIFYYSIGPEKVWPLIVKTRTSLSKLPHVCAHSRPFTFEARSSWPMDVIRQCGDDLPTTPVLQYVRGLLLVFNTSMDTMSIYCSVSTTEPVLLSLCYT